MTDRRIHRNRANQLGSNKMKLTQERVVRDKIIFSGGQEDLNNAYRPFFSFEI